MNDDCGRKADKKNQGEFDEAQMNKLNGLKIACTFCHKNYHLDKYLIHECTTDQDQDRRHFFDFKEKAYVSKMDRQDSPVSKGNIDIELKNMEL